MIDYGPANNDCNITPGKVGGTYVAIVVVVWLLLKFGIMS